MKKRDILYASQIPDLISTLKSLKEVQHSLIKESNRNEKDIEICKKKIQNRIKHMLEYLTPREQMILSARYGLKTGFFCDFETLSKTFDVTRVRIAKIEENAFKKFGVEMNLLKLI